MTNTNTKHLPPTYIAHRVFLSLLTRQGIRVKESSGGDRLVVKVEDAKLEFVFNPVKVSDSFVRMDSTENRLSDLAGIADFTPNLFAAIKTYQSFQKIYDSYSKQFEDGPATTFTIPQELWSFFTPAELVDVTPIPKLYELYGYETCLHGFMDLLPLETRKIAWTRTLVLVLDNPVAYAAMMDYGRILVNAKG